MTPPKSNNKFFISIQSKISNPAPGRNPNRPTDDNGIFASRQAKCPSAARASSVPQARIANKSVCNDTIWATPVIWHIDKILSGASTTRRCRLEYRQISLLTSSLSIPVLSSAGHIGKQSFHCLPNSRRIDKFIGYIYENHIVTWRIFIN